MDITRSGDAWKSRYRPILDWDRRFAEGEWDYLDDAGEAPRYALIAGYIHRRSNEAIVLDVGCGAGILFRYLDQSRVRYSGIDLAPTAIAQASARFPQAEFNAIDIAKYEPPPGQEFDVIVFNEVLTQVPDPFGSLSRYLNYLRPDGIAIISTYQNANPQSNSAVFTELLASVLNDGAFKALTGCEVATSEKGMKWRIDVLAGDQELDATY